MIIYVVLIISLIIVAILDVKDKISKKHKNCLYWIFVAILFILSSLRNVNVGIDTKAYYNFYENIDNITNLNDSSFEIGFTIMCKSLHYICPHPQFLLIFTSFIIILAVSYFIFTNSDYKYFSLLLFILLCCWFNYMNIMRQALAISVMLLSFNLLKKQKLKYDILFLMLSFISFSFHKVGIIACILPLLRYFKPTKMTLINISTIGIVFFISSRYLFSLLIEIFPKYEYYLDSVFNKSNYFGMLCKLLLGLFILIISYLGLNDSIFDKKFILTKSFDINKKKTKEKNIIFNCGVLYVLFLYCGMQVVIFERLANYMLIFNVVLVPNSIININKRYKMALVYLLFLVFIAYFLIISIFRPQWNGCIPYSFCFNSLNIKYNLFS